MNLIQEIVDVATNWTLQKVSMNHYINLEEIATMFYNENQKLKYDKDAIQKLIERTEEQKKEMFDKIKEIESMYHLDHS